MNFDIIFVTYNSSKWIEGCKKSIENLNYDFNNINIVVVDNNSNDNTQQLLNDWKSHSKCNSFKIINSKRNLGFGKANNIGVKNSFSDYLLVLNIDTEIDENSLNVISDAIKNSSSDFQMFEMRQIPYEHPKHYDPMTFETEWASGACVVISRKVFEEVKGFDKNIFMYCEDVELSWKVRKNGYKIMYVPQAIVTHHSYEGTFFKENAYIDMYTNDMYLRLKYGSFKDFKKACYEILKIYLKLYSVRPSHRIDSKLKLKLFWKMFRTTPKYILALFARSKSKSEQFKPNFKGFTYGLFREGYDYEITKLTDFSNLVSIIVRTYKSPNTLRNALTTIRNQTYKNIEVCVVEDGSDYAKDIVSEFDDLNINYKRIENSGRVVCGNEGLKMAKGTYLGFLDDDDFFYADHVEILMESILKNRVKIAYSLGHVQEVIRGERISGQYTVYNQFLPFATPFTLEEIATRNILPIQAALFHRDVYEHLGGFATELEYLEDWDLWVRYASKYHFQYVPKVTSIYQVPYEEEEVKKRIHDLNSYIPAVLKRMESYEVTRTMFDISGLKDYEE